MRYFVVALYVFEHLAAPPTFGASGVNLYDPDCVRGLLGTRYYLTVTPLQFQALQDETFDTDKTGISLDSKRRYTAIRSLLKKIEKYAGVSLRREEMDVLKHPTLPDRLWIHASPAHHPSFLVEVSATKLKPGVVTRLLHDVYLSSREASFVRSSWVLRQPPPYTPTESADLGSNILKKLRNALKRFPSKDYFLNNLVVHETNSNPWEFDWELRLSATSTIRGRMFSLAPATADELLRYGDWAKGIQNPEFDSELEAKFLARKRDLGYILPFVQFVKSPISVRLSRVLGETALLKTLRLERAEIGIALKKNVHTIATRSAKLFSALRQAPDLEGYGFSQRDLKFYAMGERRDRVGILIDRPEPALVIARFGDAETVWNQDEVLSLVPPHPVPVVANPYPIHLSQAERTVVRFIQQSGGNVRLSRRDFAAATNLTQDGLRSTLRSLRTKNLVALLDFGLGQNGFTHYGLTDHFQLEFGRLGVLVE